jgi:hypothetical protein
MTALALARPAAARCRLSVSCGFAAFAAARRAAPAAQSTDNRQRAKAQESTTDNAPKAQ